MDVDAMSEMSRMLYPELGGTYLGPEHRETLMAYERSCRGLGPTAIGRGLPGAISKQAARNRGAAVLRKAAALGLTSPLRRRHELQRGYNIRKMIQEFGACEVVSRLIPELTDDEKVSLLEILGRELSLEEVEQGRSGRRVLRKPVGLESIDDPEE